MKQQAKKKAIAFYEGNAWVHRVKLLQPDGSVKYSKRGGFQSEEEAEASYYKYEKEFKKASRACQILTKPNPDVDLRDYLLYWFEDVFSKRIENTTRMVCAYVLYDLILPNMQQNIKLRYANEEYFDSLLALFCGLRKGEIAGLKFGDFDVETRTIYIQRQITSNPVVSKGGSEIQSYEVIEKPPKTDNSYRRLRIPEAIAEEIEKRRAVVEANKLQYGEQYFDHDYISCQENGLPHSMAAMNGVLTRLCARHGLPHITVHGLRHMYATILIEMKVPLIKISALLGHASVNTTFEYYCEVMDENEQIITFMNHTFVPEGGVAIC